MKVEKSATVADDSGCFVCGTGNPIGMQAVFQVDREHCSSRSSVKLADEYQGWQGVVHGGILASLLDEACIYACRAKAEQCVTAELQIRYRKPVPTGAIVEVSGQLIDSSRKIWLAEAQLKIAETLYAEATARIYILNWESGQP